MQDDASASEQFHIIYNLQATITLTVMLWPAHRPPTRQSPMIAVWPLTTESWVPQYHRAATVNLHQVKRNDMVRVRFPLQLALSSNLVRSPERLQVGRSESDGNGCVGH